MGSTKIVHPDKKFSGEEGIREFLRDFEIHVAVNEWSDEKAGQFLAIFLTDDAKVFYHQEPESVRKSYGELSGALKERYEGGLALLKYKKVFNGRSRKTLLPWQQHVFNGKRFFDSFGDFEDFPR